MFIRSERLFLRPAWAEDAADLHALLRNRCLARGLIGLTWLAGAGDARAFGARLGDRRSPHFLITLPGPAGAPIVGGIALLRSHEDPALEFWIDPARRGQGYATEAGAAVLGLAQVLGHARVSATHFIDQPAAGRVLEKLGFRRGGRIIERYSQGRGLAFPAREYSRELAPDLADLDGGGGRGSRRAA